jgi:hypothetical protein
MSQPIHLVIAVDDLPAEPQVAAGKRSQRLLQQQPGLGAGLLDLALNGAQLLMKALPDLGHQPTSLAVSSLPLKCRNKLFRAQDRERGIWRRPP